MRAYSIPVFVLGVVAFGACTLSVGDTKDTPPLDDSGVVDSGAVAKSITITRAKSAGDFFMSGRLGIDSGKLGLALAAIRDPDAMSRPVEPKSVTFTVALGGGPLTCSVAQVSSSAKAAVDLVFVNDTTGSMSGTVKGIAASVEKFATDIAAGGIDARFSMYTYGDAFATKKASGSTLVIGQGDFEPPAIDPVERPYIGLGELDGFKSFLAELKAFSGLGSGGGDGEENTIGALAYAHRRVAFRDGAARMFVAIGDNPSHQEGDASVDLYPVVFQPPTGDALVEALQGSAAIHVVGHDDAGRGYYNLKSLADQTGGAFLELPGDGNVDLGALQLKDWLTQGFAGTCADPALGSNTIVVTARIGGSKVYQGTLTFEVLIE